MLSRLSDGGVIPVKRMDDLQQLSVQDFRASSYEDEDRLFLQAQRSTGAFQFPGSGEPLPASTPATIGILQQQNAATSFDAVQENIGIAVSEMIEKRWMPIIFDNLSLDEVYRITGDKDEVKMILEEWAQYQADRVIIQSILKIKRIPTAGEQQILKDRS